MGQFIIYRGSTTGSTGGVSGDYLPLTGGTVTGNVNVTGTLSATTYYGDGSNLTGLVTSDYYVTGGTYSNNNLSLNRQNGNVIISLTGITNSFTPLQKGTLGFSLDGNGADIIAGTSALLSSVLTNGVITNWVIEGEESSGSIVVDLQIWSGGSYNSMIGSGNKPTITSSKYNSDIVSGWSSTNIVTDDRLRFVVNSNSGFSKINLQVKYTKTL